MSVQERPQLLEMLFLLRVFGHEHPSVIGVAELQIARDEVVEDVQEFLVGQANQLGLLFLSRSAS